MHVTGCHLHHKYNYPMYWGDRGMKFSGRLAQLVRGWC